MAKYGTAKYGSSLYGSTPEHPYTLVTGKLMWMVQVDWDGDGVFGSAIESQAITALKIRRGRKKRMSGDGKGQVHPSGESFEIQFIDSTGRYDSFNTSSPVYSQIGAPGLLCRVLVVSTTGKGAAQPVFVGTLTDVNYDSKTGIGTLKGEGLSRFLEIGAAASVFSPCQAGGVLSPVAGYDSYFKWDGTTPLPFNYWKGRPGGLPLRVCVNLALARAGWQLGSYHGSATYNNEQPDYWYMDGASAWDTLTDLADGFAARLFFLRTGMLFCMDRLDPNGLHVGQAAPTRAQEAQGLERSAALDSLRNHVEVRVRPQSVPFFKNPLDPTTLYSEIWSNDGPIEVAPNSSVDFVIKYPDTLGKPTQASYVVENQWPAPRRRYECWSKADRTGTNLGPLGSGQGVAVVAGEAKDGAYAPLGDNQKYCTLRLANTHASLTAFFFDLGVLAGGVVETGNALQMTVEDAASIGLNGKRVASIDSRWVQNAVMAQNIAQAYVDALSTRERASAATITYQWSGQLLYTNLLTYELGMHVDFGVAGGADSLANFGMTGRWLIIGQEIQWMSPDGQDALVKLTYEKPPAMNVVAGNVSSGVGAGVASVTWSHTVPDGSNRLLVVTVSKRAFAGTDVSTVTFGGVGLTKLGAVQQAAGDYPRAEIWYLKNPAVSTGSIVVTLASGSDFIQAGAVDFTNVNQSTSFGTLVTASGAAGPASAVVAAVSGDLVIDGVAYKGADAGLGANQTLQWAATSDDVWKGVCSTEPGAGSVAMRWVIPANGWAQVAVAVKSVGS